MAQAGWTWGPPLLDVLGFSERAGDTTEGRRAQRALAVWDRLPAWQEEAPPPPSANMPVSAGEARRRLSALLAADSEPRTSQADYASAAAGAFQPRERREEPLFVVGGAGRSEKQTSELTVQM